MFVKIGTCFGVEDRMFGLHPNDEQRAKKLFLKAKNNNATLIDAKRAAADWLRAQGCNQQHIEEQLKRVKRIWVFVRIGTCFGVVDRIFGSHPNDEERARYLCADAYNHGYTLDDVQQEVEDWLRAQGCNQQHIDEQLERVVPIWDTRF